MVWSRCLVSLHTATMVGFIVVQPVSMTSRATSDMSLQPVSNASGRKLRSLTHRIQLEIWPDVLCHDCFALPTGQNIAGFESQVSWCWIHTVIFAQGKYSRKSKIIVLLKETKRIDRLVCYHSTNPVRQV